MMKNFFALLLVASFPFCSHAESLRVLDPLAVSATGDPTTAVLSLHLPEKIAETRCDLAIIGGELGGVSAALEAARAGLHVCITEPTHWLGGQLTAQGVAAFDDNQWTESSGSSRSFLALREAIRQHYAPLLRPGFRNGRDPLNPGRCWVSYECTETTVAESALVALLQPLVDSGKLEVLLRTAPVKVEREGRKIRSFIIYRFETKSFQRISAPIFLDATAQGELLPLSGAEYVTGAEARSQTGEPDAPLVADPAAAQSFTYPFVLERRQTPLPADDPQPAGYADNLRHFSFDSTDADAVTLRYGMFEAKPGTPGSFWSYRRLVDASIFAPGSFASDLAMINWDSNDLCDERMLSDDPADEARAMQHGKQLALGFAWWLRHAAPADTPGTPNGYPEVAILPQALGSQDGLAQFPYIREARRMKALETIREQDLATSGPRARAMADTVGIGQYPIDIHPCKGPAPKLPAAKPHQIPLGAMLSASVENLLAASKSLGTTHITNGAYRVHPTEWAIGAAAGQAATLALRQNLAPAELLHQPAQLLQLQRNLINSGQPIYWFNDLTANSPGFAAAQTATLLGLIELGDDLSFRPQTPITASEADLALDRLKALGRLPAAQATPPAASAALCWETLRLAGLPVETGKSGPVLRIDFAEWAVRLADSLPRP